MKTKITISFILFLVLSTYLFTGSLSYRTNTNNAVTQNQDSNFIIGCLHDGFENDFNKLDTLGFNLWHKYPGGEYDPVLLRHHPTGWTTNDKLLTDSSQYVTEVQNKLDAIYSHNNRLTLMQRPKIEWLCFGQRSDYQCETTIRVDTNFWFYSFNEHNTGKDTTDNSFYGSNQWVRYCKPDMNQTNGGADWVVRRLKANTEQSRDEIGWWADRNTEWKIKPRIRIDSTFAANVQNRDKLICRIDIRDSANTLIKSIDIKVRNFRPDDLTPYSGKYLEEFFFTPYGDTSTQVRRGAWGNRWVIEARGNRAENVINNHADIQIYWYGECEMWIDYVRVDNDVAHDLFSTDPSNIRHRDYMNWLRWEARDIACHGNSPFRFYLELFEFNHIPCMSYVSRKLDSLAYSYCGKHITLMDWPQDLLYSLHVPWEDRYRIMNLNHYVTNYVERMEISEIFLGFYPLVTAYEPSEPNPYPGRCVRPNTLPIQSAQGMISNPIPPGAYDDSSSPQSIPIVLVLCFRNNNF